MTISTLTSPFSHFINFISARISTVYTTVRFNAQSEGNSLLPTGTRLCPDGRCPVIDPTNTDGGLDGFVNIVVRISQIATYVIAVIAVLYFIYAAFLFLTGGEDGGKKGRKVIINAIIAVIIAALSYTFVQLLVNVLNDISL